MKTVQLTQEGILRAYKNGSAQNRFFLENLVGKENIPPMDVTDRIKTLEDVYAATGYTQESFNEWCEYLTPDEVAYRQIKLIATALNEGTVMDMADTDQYKYYPWFNIKVDKSKPAGFGLSYYGFAGSGAHAVISARLRFKSKELAIYAGQTFTEVYERLFA